MDEQNKGDKISDTPETDAADVIIRSCAYDENGIVCAITEHVNADFARKLERERNALADALRVRIDYRKCPDCGGEFGWTGHNRKCRHHKTEQEVI